MLEQYGYKPDYAAKCINNNKHNQVTTIYYLIHKRYEKQGLLPSHFNIDSSRKDQASTLKEGSKRGREQLLPVVINDSFNIQEQLKLEEGFFEKTASMHE
jgi:hypothetical protein